MHVRPTEWRVPLARRSRPAVAALLLCVLACAPPASRPPAPPPNVLLISLDSCRADHLGSYGYHRQTSLFIDELAAQGVLFDRAFVNTHGTTSSHTTILSSLYQETHRVRYRENDPGSFHAIPTEVQMLQELLQAAGYLTVAVTDGGNVGKSLGFARGFDLYDDRGGGVARGTEKVVDLLVRHWTGKRPVFVFYHTYQIHSPYRPPADYADRFVAGDSAFEASSANLLRYVHTAAEELTRSDLERIEALYDGEIRFTDDRLRALFARLETLGFLHHSLIVLTSDHGEEFAEHGGLLHRGLLYDELIHVPLILVGQNLGSGILDPRLVGSVDIAPTILGHLGLPIPSRMEGIDLFVANDTDPRRALFSQYGHRRYSVRSERWKLIANSLPASLELYDLHTDPGEQHDLAARHGEVVTRLQRGLAAWKGARHPVSDEEPEPVHLDPEEIEHLKSLGYLAD
jgi:arylsulfatase A-like enzyme